MPEPVRVVERPPVVAVLYVSAFEIIAWVAR
jgi:hypothetical protein